MIVFENKPSTNTPINEKNLNYNFKELNDYFNKLNISIEKKENGFIRGANTVTLNANTAYLIACKAYTTVSQAGGIGVVLGAYDIYWIGSSGINVSRDGVIYNITSDYGTVYITAIPIS